MSISHIYYLDLTSEFMSSEKETSIFVGLQKRALEDYRSLEKSSSMQNIAYFLDAFIREHEEIINKIKEGSESTLPSSPDLRHMEATRHLVENEVVDANSLQGVLLHICKVEEALTEESRTLAGDVAETPLMQYIRWQEKIHEDADTLYHRFVEAAV